MNRFYQGDALAVLKTLPSESVHCVVTSPPYWGLRDYGVEGQIGLETSLAEYVAALVGVFREVRRVLRGDGTLFLNLGDSYFGGGQRAVPYLKPKDLCGVPWRVAFALQADGWYLRSEIIWHKPNPMPESVTDRPTKAHEQIFLLSKSARYFYDADAVREPHTRLWDANNGGSISTGRMVAAGGAMGDMSTHPKGYPLPNPLGRNRRSVWTVASSPFKGAHFACFPPKLIEPCILAGSPVGGVVLDPFAGSGTTLMVAATHGRDGTGIELNPEYIQMAIGRAGGELVQKTSSTSQI